MKRYPINTPAALRLSPTVEMGDVWPVAPDAPDGMEGVDIPLDAFRFEFDPDYCDGKKPLADY